MSGRGGGGGRGGGRGRGQSQQGQGQQQSASGGRGGGGGRGDGGRGRGGGGGSGRGSSGSAPAPFPSLSPSSLSGEFQQKVTVQPSAPAPAWARPSSSAVPQPAPVAAQPQKAQPVPVAQPQKAPPVQVGPPAHVARPVMAAPAAQVAPPAQVARPVAPPVQMTQQQQAMVVPVASSKAIRPPSRPGYGKIGKKCIVRANHFLVQVEDRDLHHYDVSITPEVTSKKYCREIMKKLVDSYKASHLGMRMLAFDGRKSAYCGGPLPFTSKEFEITLVDDDGARKRERKFKVSIKFAAKADLHHLKQFLGGRQPDSPQETIQALDVALRATPSFIYEVVGRSFFHTDLGDYGELGNGIEYWKGFYQSLRPTQMGLSLNVDMSARAFYEPILVTEFVGKYFNKDLSRPLSDQDRIKLRKVLKGLKVELVHQGYKRRSKISGLSAQPLSQLMFLDETGTQKSVVQYFREKYGIRLQYTALPAIQSGSDSKPVYLPMEICKFVAGQRYTRKLNEKQVTQLLRATCQRPKAREDSIAEMVAYNNYSENDLVKEEFGMAVKPQLVSIEARVLPPPTLKYHESGQESVVAPSVGQWNMINKKMVNGAKVDFWTCVNFSRSRFEPSVFCDELINMCRSKGMVFVQAPLLPIKNENPANIERVLTDIHRLSVEKLKTIGDGKQKLQLLIIILPDVTGSHGKIKKKCETELGIISQCCQARQLMKGGKQYLENLSLKINVKAGGRNTVLEQALLRRIPYLTDMPTIVFGADVTHPQPGEDSSPSIAAVVASMDWPEVTKYRALVSAQPHREEIIVDLYKTIQDPIRGLVHGGLIRDLLIAYRRSTGQKPHRIIFYRDGVSEGQFSQVLLHEVDAIRKACNSLEENYQPRITFVVVQKRHHTRLFPERHGDRGTTDKSGNILPGTVVDTKICHPTEFDFYLCSHAGIQGTSRPAHYHVLYDENKFSADGLQMLTNQLCYTYARCTRSVSIVPPAYYAHLAAFRARDYMEGEYSDGGSTPDAAGGGNATRTADYYQRLPVMKDNIKDVMFYC